MKWSITLLLPLLVVTASCSTSARFSQQMYQDGIYVSAYPTESARLKTEEDFQLEALRNIREKQMLEAFDSLKVEYRDVYPGTMEYSMYFDIVPLFALTTGYSWAFNNWYWRRWHLGWSGYGPVGFYDPFWIGSRWDWYPFYDPFWNWTWNYGPYYSRYGYYGPGYYGPGYYGPGYYGPAYYIGGGGGFRNNLYYTPRNTTQPAGGYRGSGNAVRGGGYDGGSSVAPRSSGEYKYTPRRVSGSTVSGSGSAAGSGSRNGSGRTYRPSTSGTTSSSGSMTTSRRSTSSGSSGSSYSGSSSRGSSYSSGSSSRGSSYSGGSSSHGGSSYSGGGRSGGGGGGRSSGGSGGRR